jgi:hypothetical protein
MAATPASPAPIVPEAQAFYNPSIQLKHTPPPSRPAILAGRRNYSISCPRAVASLNVSNERGKTRPQPIHHPSDDFYTQDEALEIVPNPNLTSHALGITEDNLLFLPSHPTPGSAKQNGHFGPTINVDDVQTPDPRPQGLCKVGKQPSRSRSSSALYIKNSNPLVLQQPRPIRPLGGLPAHLNIQLSGLDDAHYYAESFRGKGKERRSYGFSAIFEAMDRFTRRDSITILKENI